MKKRRPFDGCLFYCPYHSLYIIARVPPIKEILSRSMMIFTLCRSPMTTHGASIKQHSYSIIYKHNSDNDYIYTANTICIITPLSETPPLAWEICNANYGGLFFCRNTPTCVGNSCAKSGRLCSERKHPHLRGKQTQIFVALPAQSETPPLTWEIASLFVKSQTHMRNTPTYVGNSYDWAYILHDREKHPHLRGKQETTSTKLWCKSETPPLTWEIGLAVSHVLCQLGNTPTYVGNRHTQQ